MFPSLAQVANDSDRVVGLVVADELAVVVLITDKGNDDPMVLHERLRLADEGDLSVAWNDSAHRHGFQVDHHAVREVLEGTIHST